MVVERPNSDGDELAGLPLSEQNGQLVLGVDHVALAVNDIDTAQVWFTDHLGLVKIHDVTAPDGAARLAFFECGNAKVQLIQPLEPGTVADHLR